jgi:hypothetical protein
VLHHAEAYFSWSDIVISRVFVSFCFGFRFVIGFRLVVVRVVGLDPRCGPARPGPARAPLPQRAPPLLSPLPRRAPRRGPAPAASPRALLVPGEPPSPSREPPPLSRALPARTPSPRRAPPRARPPLPRRARPRREPLPGGSPRHGPPHAPRPAPWPRPVVAPLLVPVPRRFASHAPARLACLRHAQRSLARATVVALRSTLVLIHFNFSLVDVLRRALRRATVHSKFVLFNVLRRTLRRAMILLIYIY